MSRCTTLSAPRWSGLGLLSLLVLAPFAGAGAAPPSPPPPSPSPLLLGLLGDFDRPITVPSHSSARAKSGATWA